MLTAGKRFNLTKEIYERLQADFFCEDLALMADSSTTQFFSVFQRVFRMPPMTYVREARLHKAQCLLLYSKLNVSEIAAKVSPRNVSQFSRFFLRESGIRPLQYRSLVQTDH
jgi:AraC-like DNA-binding protein